VRAVAIATVSCSTCETGQRRLKALLHVAAAAVAAAAEVAASVHYNYSKAVPRVAGARPLSSGGVDGSGKRLQSNGRNGIACVSGMHAGHSFHNCAAQQGDRQLSII
jgi:hypothetical protein